MGKKVRTMRGEILDWDLASVKNQMAKKPAPLNVKERQDFIDSKLRRRVKRVKDQIHELQSTKVDRKIAEAPVAEQELIDENKPVATEETTTPKKRTIKRKTPPKTEE